MPPSASRDTVRVTSADAVAHCRQAQEYLRSAQAASTSGDHNAATGNAVNAGINAGDAVTGMSTGSRWKGAHEQSAAFVARSGAEGKEVARELRRLIPLKNRAQYESSAISASTAASALAAAQRAVAVAVRATVRATTGEGS